MEYVILSDGSSMFIDVVDCCDACLVGTRYSVVTWCDSLSEAKESLAALQNVS